MNPRKKIFVRTTLVLCVSGSIFFVFFLARKNISMPSRAPTSDSHDTLFSCTNFQTTYYNKAWGPLNLAAAQGNYSKNRVLRCLCLTATLLTQDNGNISIVADEGTLSQSSHTIILTGNVRIQTIHGVITTDKLTADTKNKTLELYGNVHTIFMRESVQRR